MSTSLEDVMSEMRLCIGRDEIEKDRLVYFMSLNRLLGPPSKIREVVDIAIEDEILEEDGDFVRFRTEGTDEPSRQARKPAKKKAPTKKKPTRKPPTKKLPDPEKTFDAAVARFIGISRLPSVMKMPSDEIDVSIIRAEPALVHFRMPTRDKTIHMQIDEGGKVIAHSCPIHGKTGETGQFCKHFARVVLLLAEEHLNIAARVMQSLDEDLESWNFITPEQLTIQK